MSTTNSQTPLREALDCLCRREDGIYTVFIPQSICFGTVVLGGLVEALIHKAAVDLVSSSAKAESRSHVHAQCISAHFFRPTLPAPRETIIFFEVVHVAKGATTLRFEVKQNDKINATGHLSMANLSVTAPLSVVGVLNLVPPPPSVSLQALAMDEDPNWVTYHAPWDPKSYRRAQLYMRYSLPKQHTNRSFVDQWVSPAWLDSGIATGAVWTNELVHFVLDNAVPTLNDLIGLDGEEGMYNKLIKTGLRQGEARRKGSDEVIRGEGIEIDRGWIVSTSAISTEIMRLLPEEGTKWLFMRCVTRNILNNRTDYTIDLLDSNDHLIAVSHHCMTAISTKQKLARSSVL